MDKLHRISRAKSKLAEIDTEAILPKNQVRKTSSEGIEKDGNIQLLKENIIANQDPKIFIDANLESDSDSTSDKPNFSGKTPNFYSTTLDTLFLELHKQNKKEHNLLNDYKNSLAQIDTIKSNHQKHIFQINTNNQTIQNDANKKLEILKQENTHLVSQSEAKNKQRLINLQNQFRTQTTQLNDKHKRSLEQVVEQMNAINLKQMSHTGDEKRRLQKTTVELKQQLLKLENKCKELANTISIKNAFSKVQKNELNDANLSVQKGKNEWFELSTQFDKIGNDLKKANDKNLRIGNRLTLQEKKLFECYINHEEQNSDSLIVKKQIDELRSNEIGQSKYIEKMKDQLVLERAKQRDLEKKAKDLSNNNIIVKRSWNKISFEFEKIASELCLKQNDFDSLSQKFNQQTQSHKATISTYECDRDNQNFKLNQLRKSQNDVIEKLTHIIRTSNLQKLDKTEFPIHESNSDTKLEEKHGTITNLVVVVEKHILEQDYKLVSYQKQLDALLFEKNKQLCEKEELVNSIQSNKKETCKEKKTLLQKIHDFNLSEKELLQEIKRTTLQNLQYKSRIEEFHGRLNQSTLARKNLLNEHKYFKAQAKIDQEKIELKDQLNSKLQKQCQTNDRLLVENKNALENLKSLQYDLDRLCKKDNLLREEIVCWSNDNSILKKENLSLNSLLKVELERNIKMERTLEEVDKSATVEQTNGQQQLKQINHQRELANALKKTICTLKEQLSKSDVKTSELKTRINGFSIAKMDWINEIQELKENLSKIQENETSQIKMDRQEIESLRDEVQELQQINIETETESIKTTRLQSECKLRTNDLEQRELQIKNYAREVDTQKTALRKHVILLVQELKTTKSLNPLKNYVNIIAKEVSNLEINLSKIPLNGKGRSGLERTYESLINQRNSIEQTLSETDTSFSIKIESLLRLARGKSLVPLPPLPPKNSTAS